MVAVLVPDSLEELSEGESAFDENGFLGINGDPVRPLTVYGQNTMRLDSDDGSSSRTQLEFAKQGVVKFAIYVHSAGGSLRIHNSQDTNDSDADFIRCNTDGALDHNVQVGYPLVPVAGSVSAAAIHPATLNSSGIYFVGTHTLVAVAGARALEVDGSLRVLCVGGIGVGNSASASSLGTVTKKMEVFDASGNSLGFVPIYNAIT